MLRAAAEQVLTPVLTDLRRDSRGLASWLFPLFRFKSSKPSEAKCLVSQRLGSSVISLSTALGSLRGFLELGAPLREGGERAPHSGRPPARLRSGDHRLRTVLSSVLHASGGLPVKYLFWNTHKFMM